MNKLGQLFYLGQWYVRSIFGRRAPLQSVIFILDKCNLRCKHCSVYELDHPRIKTMEQIRAELEDCYRAGSRFVDFEGGELYLWRDGDKTIDDVLDMAREVGFYSATITTNAQLPFNGSHADQVWVSMDGVGKYHDMIRGEGAFARLEKNIKAFGKHKPICVNMVVNNLNHSCVEEALEYVRQSDSIDCISVNFHTPFADTAHLYLEPQRRNEIIDLLIQKKKAGYPIMNSISGLKAMRMVTDKKTGKMHPVVTDQYCWVTNFIFSDGSRAPKCMGSTHGICDRCGFSMGGEMYSLFHLRIDTILSGLKLRTR